MTKIEKFPNNFKDTDDRAVYPYCLMLHGLGIVEWICLSFVLRNLVFRLCVKNNPESEFRNLKHKKNSGIKTES